MTSHNLRRDVAAYQQLHPEAGRAEAVRAVRSARPSSPRRISPDAAPPAGWPPSDRYPVMLAVLRDANGDGALDHIAAYDLAGGELLAEAMVAHAPAAELQQRYAHKIGEMREGAPARVDLEQLVALGRPDLAVHRIGFEARGFSTWSEFPDGSWRTVGEASDAAHSATATPVTGGGTHLVVIEHPDTVVLDLVVPEHSTRSGRGGTHLQQVLDQHGYTVAGDFWSELPGHVLYGRLHRGHLAEREWSTHARVRVVRESKVGNIEHRERTYRVGEVVKMYQWGRDGHEVERDCWWSSFDIDGAFIIGAEDVEVIEVLEENPPFWAEAERTPEQAVELLAEHHRFAAEAVAAWAAAGLVFTVESRGLAIRTPAPERAMLGHIRRDYRQREARPGLMVNDWDAPQVYSGPYEAVIREHGGYPRTAQFAALPRDPFAAQAKAREVAEGARPVPVIEVEPAAECEWCELPAGSCACRDE